MNSDRLSLLMRKLEIPAVPHGDRSSVRTGPGDAQTSRNPPPKWSSAINRARR